MHLEQMPLNFQKLAIIDTPTGLPMLLPRVPHMKVSTVEARKLEHHYPHALKVKYKGS